MCDVIVKCRGHNYYIGVGINTRTLFIIYKALFWLLTRGGRDKYISRERRRRGKKWEKERKLSVAFGNEYAAHIST